MNDDSHLDLFRSDELIHARRRVFRQLVESLVFERIVRSEDDAGRLVIPGQDEGGNDVRYLAEGVRSELGRLRLGARPILRQAGAQPHEATSLARFLIETRSNHGADPERLAQFIRELDETVLKHAQALRRTGVRALADQPSYDARESACGDGHPYHPAFKSRIGFDLADNAAFGPEFAPDLRPLYLAAASDATVRSAARGLDGDRLVEEEIGSALTDEWRARIARVGGDPARYTLIPVHPWQWREQLPSLFHEDLRDGRLIPLGRAPDVYRPQQSIRTLANISNPRRSSLKHALGIVNTSTARILAPHTVANAPLLSDWLVDLARRDAFLDRELGTIFLREIRGAAYDPVQPALLQPRSYGALACIWRESLHAHLRAGEQAYPFTALTHLDPDGQPAIAPFLAAHGTAWIERLVEVAVLPLVHLLVAHGIALEAHAQNMVLIVEGGWPSRVALKDFHDGVRFSPAHLAEPDRQPRLHATPARHVRVNRNSFLVADGPAAVRDFLYDAFFFINLGELARFLGERCGVSEDWFWSRVDATLTARERRFPHLAARAELFDLRPRHIEVEKLTNRRLFAETDVQTHAVALPFARVGTTTGLDD